MRAKEETKIELWGFNLSLVGRIPLCLVPKSEKHGGKYKKLEKK